MTLIAAMNIVAAFTSFSYKVKALFRANKKPTARVYEHVPKFERQSRKNEQKSPTKHSSRSPSTSRKRNEPARPSDQRNFSSFFNNFKESFSKIFSGADSDQEEFIKPAQGRTDSTATSPTAAKVNKQSGYDVEATGEDDLDSKEDTKLLQEGEEDDGEVFAAEESKGTTSSLQAGWNISNLIQGKKMYTGLNGDNILHTFVRVEEH